MRPGSSSGGADPIAGIVAHVGKTQYQDLPESVVGVVKSFDEVVEKLRKCAALSARPVARERLDAFVAAVRTLEAVADVRGLCRLLGEDGSRSRYTLAGPTGG
jgi:hypothetical protein